MAEEIKVTLDLAGFGEFQAAAEAAVQLAVEAAAEAVVNDAKDRAPVSKTGSNGNPPGFMRDSTHWEPVGPLEVEVLADADYSLFVDEGTHRQPAQPWFTPAVEAGRARFAERVAEALAEATRAT